MKNFLILIIINFFKLKYIIYINLINLILLLNLILFNIDYFNDEKCFSYINLQIFI